MLNLVSLREQIYRYLREQMHSGNLLPGSTIDMTVISNQLGVSRTPLRDALIRLECEGFVKILPRRGVVVATLSLEDVKNLYEIIGMLEGGVIRDCFDQLDEQKVKEMEALNNDMVKAVYDERFDSYYQLNLDFHNVYLELSDNLELKKMLDNLKRRLYDFPRRSYIKEWELQNCDEHTQFLAEIRSGDRDGAIRVMRDIHWSFQTQERHIKKFYSRVARQIRADRALQDAKS